MKKLALLFMMTTFSVLAEPLRVATFNVSMEAGNYVPRGEVPTGNELFKHLSDDNHPQIRNVAKIIQRVRPDILLLNEFDYTEDAHKGVIAFINHYLNRAQGDTQPLFYPYFYVAPVNTGVPTGLDLNRDGETTQGDDNFGFGLYPGQYGMAILSRYPIDTANVRTFQRFLWKDMPGNLLSDIRDAVGNPWYSEQAQAILRLSSKSHWDVPVRVNGQTVHILASHPTPPVFDGEENRNGKRNHDEIRFWLDYLDPQAGGYIYDDQGRDGAFSGQAFVLVGDLNASPYEGDSFGGAIGQLLNHPALIDPKPRSEGGATHSPDNRYADMHTAGWRMRIDYALPSKAGLELVDSGVYWPAPESEGAALVKDRQSSSDHRLVWVDVALTDQ